MTQYTDHAIAFKATEAVWLCLTTLHHRRFVEDAIHIVGLPPGARIRLRYRRQYIHPDLWAQVSEGFVSWGARVLIVLAATKTDETNEVAPLREGRIVSARCEGSVLIIDVALDKFVFEFVHMNTFWKEIEARMNTICRP